MRVRVGNGPWISAEPGIPIAVELTDSDKLNIQHMPPTASRYGVFDDADTDTDAMRAWLAQDGDNANPSD